MMLEAVILVYLSTYKSISYEEHYEKSKIHIIESLFPHFQRHMMNKIHNSRPEPVLFLLEALDAMLQYHEIHREFPENWSSLDIDFANGPFRIGEPDTHPTMNTGKKWRPKGCEYTYWIKKATKESFVIQAINQENVPEYEITQELDYPVSLIGGM